MQALYTASPPLGPQVSLPTPLQIDRLVLRRHFGSGSVFCYKTQVPKPLRKSPNSLDLSMSEGNTMQQREALMQVKGKKLTMKERQELQMTMARKFAGIHKVDALTAMELIAVRFAEKYPKQYA